LVDRNLGPILRSRCESDVLLETLSVWLDTGSSLTATAAQLYCHRNTVLKRINRIVELTGMPADSGDARLGWALALRARSLPAAAHQPLPADEGAASSDFRS
jgi:DNA-binding PucR family transcriptional regulator